MCAGILCIAVLVASLRTKGSSGLRIPHDRPSAVTIGDSYRLQLPEASLVAFRPSGEVLSKHDTTGGFSDVCPLGLMRPYGV